MARQRFLWCTECNTWRPRDEVLAERARRVGHNGAPRLSAPAVIGVMDPVRSMIDGRYYDDKRSYHKHVARNGCEVVGFDSNWESQIVKPRYDERAHEEGVVADVKRAIQEAAAK